MLTNFLNYNDNDINMDKNEKILKTIIEYIVIAFGAYLMSLSINLFLLPSKITTGGASGIGTILYYLFEINMSITILLVNIPLFIFSIAKLGVKFSIKSIFGTGIFSLFLEIFTYNKLVLESNLDIVISSIYGGLILGIGLSLVFKAGGSTGGSDLLANIIKRKNNNLNISKIMLAIDGIIILFLILTFKDINIGLYSAIAIYISSKAIDVIFEGANYTKVVNIITINDDSITKEINKVLKRGATVTKCIGAYSREEFINIICVVTLPEIGKVKNIVRSIDKNALIYITNANEVIGKGFKRI